MNHACLQIVSSSLHRSPFGRVAPGRVPADRRHGIGAVRLVGGDPAAGNHGVRRAHGATLGRRHGKRRHRHGRRDRTARLAQFSGFVPPAGQRPRRGLDGRRLRPARHQLRRAHPRRHPARQLLRRRHPADDSGDPTGVARSVGYRASRGVSGTAVHAGRPCRVGRRDLRQDQGPGLSLQGRGTGHGRRRRTVHGRGHGERAADRSAGRAPRGRGIPAERECARLSDVRTLRPFRRFQGG